MSSRLHTVAELPQFIRDAEAASLSDDERKAIVDTVAADPRRGDMVPGSGGIRKVRFGRSGRGKSGGLRVMVAYVGEDAPAYLLAILEKRDRANFTRSEVEAMRHITNEIKRHWKGGNR